jgi:hypothetical protein
VLGAAVLVASLALAWHAAHAVSFECGTSVHAQGECDSHVAGPCGDCAAARHARRGLGAGHASMHAASHDARIAVAPHEPERALLALALEVGAPRAPPSV